MSNQKILEKAIKKAVKNGLDPVYATEVIKLLPEGSDHPAFIRGVVFDHDFAKALWGEYGHVPEARYRFSYKKNSGVEKIKTFRLDSAVSHWQYHLQQIVIADDPIKYLGDNL